MNTFSEVKAVAFDLDGTLVDSLDDLAQAANAMRGLLGMPNLPQDVLKSFVGDGLGRLVHRALTNTQDEMAESSLWEEGFALYLSYYAKHLTDHTLPYPEVVDTLALLKTLGLPLVLITNKNQIFAKSILTHLGLIDSFSLLIGGDTLEEKKPSAQPLLYAAEVLNILPENILMVGDSQNDIISAHRAGSLSVGVSYGYENMAELALNPETRPDLIIDKISLLYDTLRAAYQVQ